MRRDPSASTVTADQLAYQGILTHPTDEVRGATARAAVDYANAIAQTLDPDATSLWRAGPDPTVGPSAPLSEYVISTHAYGDAAAAPYFPAPSMPIDGPVDFDGALFGPDARVTPLGEPLDIDQGIGRLHPRLMPFVVGSSDLPEWGQVPDPGITVAMLQSRFPWWFNRLRWAMLADHVGIYEYAYGLGFVVPRLYEGSTGRCGSGRVRRRGRSTRRHIRTGHRGARP